MLELALIAAIGCDHRGDGTSPQVKFLIACKAGGLPKNKAIPAYRLRISPDKKDGRAAKRAPAEKPFAKEADFGEYILCRQCHQVVTSAAERISVQGSHRHTFANPHGIVFEIGCFRSVPGCGFVGSATSEFSWFKGFSWRIAICSKCLTHLGWLYASAGSETFSGLILDRLIESKEG